MASLSAAPMNLCASPTPLTNSAANSFSVDSVPTQRMDIKRRWPHRPQEVPSSEFIRPKTTWERVEDAEEGGREGTHEAGQIGPPHHRRNVDWVRAFRSCLLSMTHKQEELETKRERSEDEKERKEVEVMHCLAEGMGVLGA